MPIEPEEDEEERPSKSQLKREMLDLQTLGAELAALPEDELRTLSLPENLLDAIREYRRTPTHGGRRRQMQYIGKLMRTFDGQAARTVVETIQQRRDAEAQALHDTEQWRTRLLAGDDALTAWIAENPDSDLRKLRSLIRAARAAPEAPGTVRARRELFRFLRGPVSDKQSPVREDPTA